MIDIKSYVNSVCKSAEFIDVLILEDMILVDVADTALAVIRLDYSTEMNIAFRYNGSDPNFGMNGNDRNINEKICRYWFTYMNMSSYFPIIASCEDLRAIPEYEALLSMKADDGMQFYKMPTSSLYKHVFIPVFSGFPNLSKSDNVGVEVRRLDPGTLLIEYHIYKKKIKCNYTMYFRALDLERKQGD